MQLLVWNQFDLGAAGIARMELLGHYFDLMSGLIGAVIGAGITITVSKYSLGKRSTFSNQSGSQVGGDQVGRDKKNN